VSQPGPQLTASARINAAYRLALPAIKARSDALIGPSWAERLVGLPEDERKEILLSLSPTDFASLLYEWGFWARPKQIPPTDIPWRWLLYCGGRGAGKSRTGAEFIRARVEAGAQSIGLVGPTYRHVAHYMIGGRKGRKGNGSGLLDVFPDHQRPRWFKTDGIIEFHTSAVAYVFTAEDPEVRGPNLDSAWIDEPVKMQHLGDIFDNIELTMRSDDITPQGMMTTTPQNLDFLKEMFARPDAVTVLGSTDENESNLDPSYLKTLDRRYSGSRLEKQERHGEIVDDDDGALWKPEMIRIVDAHPPLKRVEVAIDPAGDGKRRSDETGILVVGLGNDDRLYVLADYSAKHSWDAWAEKAIEAFVAHKATGIIVERNKFVGAPASNLRAAMKEAKGELASVAMKLEEVISEGDKAVRADPVVTLYKRGFVFHVGEHPGLEAEMTGWNPITRPISPGRIDALVLAVTALAGISDGPPLDAVTETANAVAANVEIRKALAGRPGPSPSSLSRMVPRGRSGRI
jgi:phage terminase large subunit-like protein